MELPDSALIQQSRVAVKSKRATPTTYEYTNVPTGNNNFLNMSMELFRKLYIENYRNSITNGINLSASPSAYKIPEMTDAQIADKVLASSKVFFSRYESYMAQP